MAIIKTETEHSVTLLRAARQAEITQAEEAAAESRARLKDCETQILADPLLRPVYELLKPIQADAGHSSAYDGG